MEDLKKLVELARATDTPKTSPEALKQLIAAALNPDDSDSRHLIDPRAQLIQRFIDMQDIRPGTKAVATRLVYDRYCRAVKDPLTLKVFNKILTKLFSSGKSNGILFVYLDPTSIGLVADYTMYKDPRFFKKKRKSGKSKSKQAQKGQQDGNKEQV